MRVLFLNHNVVGSGTYSRAFNLARQLANRGYEVTLITTSRGARLRPRRYASDGLETIEAPDLFSGRARTGWDPYNTLIRTVLVRRRGFDIVHAFDSRPAVIYPALRATAGDRALFVMDWADWWGRGGWIQERSGWLVRTTFGPIESWFEEAYRLRAHGMTVASRALGERSIALGLAPERVHVLPGGCEPTLQAVEARERARLRLAVPPDTPLVLHLGVLTPGDYAFLRQAFAHVSAREPGALLVLAGRTGIRIRPEPGDSSICVTGPTAEGVLRDWLAAATVCVVPCRDTIGNRGRWPSKVNDYITAGRAVVMPRVSDAALAIEQAGAGWITAATPEDFADGIGVAIADVAAADAAGARGQAMAAGELAWPRLTDRLIGFYERIARAR